jgi:glutathione synthase/RimK-type ligase-like ATP-grasp enzyme
MVPMAAPTSPTPPRRVALATCRELPALDPDDAVLPGLLARHGVVAAPAVWDDPAVDWSGFDLIVLRSTWDYTKKPAAFLAWVDRLPRVLNPAPVVRWNADKRYLLDLAAAGVPVIPTTVVGPRDAFVLPPGRFVVKPAVGAGSKDAAGYETRQAEQAAAHVRRLHRAGMTALVQPYLDQIDADGEADLVFVGGSYSHAVRKGAMLGHRPRVEGPLFFAEDIRPHVATPGERAVAEQALLAVPGGADRLLYARVDLLPTAGGGAVVNEVELIEPSLFLMHGPGSGERLAELTARAAGAQP